MFAVARLHATAERDQIFIGIDHDALRRLRRPGIVDAFVESHPSAAIFLAATYLWPRQSTTHCPLPSIPPCPRQTEAPALASHGVGLPTDQRITGSRRRVKKGGVADEPHRFFCSVFARAPCQALSGVLRADPRRKVAIERSSERTRSIRGSSRRRTGQTRRPPASAATGPCYTVGP